MYLKLKYCIYSVRPFTHKCASQSRLIMWTHMTLSCFKMKLRHLSFTILRDSISIICQALNGDLVSNDPAYARAGVEFCTRRPKRAQVYCNFVFNLWHIEFN